MRIQILILMVKGLNGIMGMPDYRLLSSDTERIPLRNRVQSLYYKLRTKVFPFDLWPRCNFSTQVPNERGKTGIYILQYGPRTGHKIRLIQAPVQLNFSRWQPNCENKSPNW